jgi:arylsulfatase A-like enzyme
MFYGVFLALTLQFSFAAMSALPLTDRRPNIVFIVADDMGWNDVGWHNPKVLTPHLDKLAREGVRLNNYYVQSVCSPSRTAFMTGFYPFHAGMQHFVLEPMQATGLPLHFETLPQKLKTLGYTTHAVGKWHLGFCKWEYTPTYRGFDSFYGFLGGMNDHFTHYRSNWAQYPSSSGLDFRFNKTLVRDQKGVYSAFTYAKRAENIIANHDSTKPLFLYLPFQNAHAPLQAPEEYIKLYSTIKDNNRRIFLAMVTALDVAIGMVVESLQNKGMMNDTLIVFTSDNGGPVQAGGNNWPLRGSKHSFYEGGTRASAFVHGAMLPHKNIDYEGMMHAVDWLPTFTEAAGGEVSSALDGKSQWQSLTEMTSSPRDEFVYSIDEVDVRAAIRKGNYKLIVGDPLSPLLPDQGGWFVPPEGANLGTPTHSMPWWCSFWYPLLTNDILRCPINHLSIKQRQAHPAQQTRNLFGFNATVQLFDIANDPTEHNDISNLFPDVVDVLYDRLKQYIKTLVPSRYPPETARADPKYFNYTWSPGWCW